MSKHINGISDEIYQITGLPHGILSAEPVVQIFGNKEMIIEGAEKIDYYDKDSIKICCVRKSINIIGADLTIKCLANKNLSVCGCIKSFQFE